MGITKSLIELKNLNSKYLPFINEDNNIPNSIIDYNEVEKSIFKLLDLDKFDFALMNGKAEDKEDYDRELKNKSNIIAIGGPDYQEV